MKKQKKEGEICYDFFKNIARSGKEKPHIRVDCSKLYGQHKKDPW